MSVSNEWYRVRECRLGSRACRYIEGDTTHLSGGHSTVVKGWSKESYLRFRERLMSISPFEDTGVGVTLTVGRIPTDDEWCDLTRKVQYWCRDNKVIAVWVVEWQRRGAPHLHLAVRGGTEKAHKLVKYWLKQTAFTGTEPQCQHVTALYDRDGFLGYLLKHASKGYITSIQKRDYMPAGWERTGRMWGMVGKWEFDEIREFMLSRSEFEKLQRHVADALGYAEIPFWWDRTMVWYDNVDVELRNGGVAGARIVA